MGKQDDIPKYDDMYAPFLECLSDGKPHTLKEIRGYISRYFHLTEAQMAILLPSGQQTVFANRVAWSRTYLKKAGLIDSPARATFQITAEGVRILNEKPNRIDNHYLMKFPSFRAFLGKPEDLQTESISDSSEETPDDMLEAAFEKISQRLADELLAEVYKLSPTAFERLVLDLMAKMGYGTFASSTVTAATGDEGIDGIIMEDKLGFDLIYVQAKRWSSDHPVGRPDIQAFVGAIAGKSGKGLFVTTSTFTRQAVEYAAQQHIILIDGPKLARYMIEYSFGVTTRKIFAVKAMDSDFFDEYQAD